MKLYYDSEHIDEVRVVLSERDRIPDEFEDELALGVSILMIKAMQENYPNKQEHFAVGEEILELVQENLAEWRHGVFEIEACGGDI